METEKILVVDKNTAGVEHILFLCAEVCYPGHCAVFRSLIQYGVYSS